MPEVWHWHLLYKEKNTAFSSELWLYILSIQASMKEVLSFLTDGNATIIMSFSLGKNEREENNFS